MRTLLCFNKYTGNYPQRYVKCHIMLLFATILFGDKLGAAVYWKFLPLLRNFAGIIQFNWGSACLAHLYRSLCRATRVDCKEMDGPLTLLLTWAWIHLPFLAPISGNPQLTEKLSHGKWRNWDHRGGSVKCSRLREREQRSRSRGDSPNADAEPANSENRDAKKLPKILGLYGRI
ncbi:hypothetical protein Ahy_A03g011395 isoform A [Arachis hypogaea]|uniref:Aminotransferase-like plant mobile domain-containing protein n=1 Tax=Arachis hypogaea TaxID=3818 RepID=A0A445DQL4_ARAHY|nr:hypothetical protein Ahy_A03g011395 isoform A [Arachis hypogaea]